MKLLSILAFACTALTVSAQVCEPREVVFLIDQSENAARASSNNRTISPFDILKQAITYFLTNNLIASSSIRIGAFGYSSSSAVVNIIPRGSTPSQAMSGINLIGTGTNAGSWTHRGFESITTGPSLPENMLIILSSQGSGSQSKRTDAQTQYNRVAALGWKPYVIGIQGFNEMDIADLRIVNGGAQPVILVERNPADPLDPKSYRELPGEFMNIINNILCAGTTSTLPPTTTTSTTTQARTTRSTTPRVYGLCTQCLMEGGYGFDFHPEFCDSFYQCLADGSQIKKDCPDGTLWDGSSCNFIASVPCPTAPCESQTSQNRYPSGKCCNKYFQCNNGVLQTMSCNVGQVYDQNSRSCVTPTSNITQACADSAKYLCDVNMNGPLDTNECAGYSPDPFGDPCIFLYIGNVIPVPAGTTWEQKRCTLTFMRDNLCLTTNTTDRDLTTSPATVCNANFLATYNGGSRTVYSERLQQELSIYSTVQEVLLSNDGLTFTSGMRDPFLYYYYFNNRNVLSNSAYRLRFRLDNPQLNVVYDILSNSYCSLCQETVSITASATSPTRIVVTATFLTTAGSTVSTSAIIDIRNPNDMLEAIIIVGDSTVYGRVYALSGGNASNQPSDFNTVAKNADIETTRCGFQLGRGSHQHFVGVIDEFAVYEKCQDIRSVLR